MLGKLFGNKVKDSINKYAGKTDFLEALCASSALVAAADGDISDSEVEATTKIVVNNPMISGAFPRAQIEKTIDQMLRRAEGGRSGRAGLLKEIEDILQDQDMAESVLLAAIDVADAEGGIDDAEWKVLEKIGQMAHLDARKLAEL